MTVTVVDIIPAKAAENSQTTQYTSTDAKTIIDKFTVTNTSSAIASISVNLVATGDSASASNLIVDNKTLAIDETYTMPELVGQVLEADDFISTIASAASSITIKASGRQIT